MGAVSESYERSRQLKERASRRVENVIQGLQGEYVLTAEVGGFPSGTEVKFERVENGYNVFSVTGAGEFKIVPGIEKVSMTRIVKDEKRGNV